MSRPKSPSTAPKLSRRLRAEKERAQPNEAAAHPERPPLTVSRPELLINESDEAFRAFVHGLLAVAAQVQRIRGGFADLIGLSGIQYTILISIRHLETNYDVSVKLVADHLNLSGAFVTSETGKLLRMGLIRKELDAKDQRRVRLTVTDEGRTRLAALAPVQRKVNDVLFGSLSAEQFRELGTIVPEMVVTANRALRLLRYHAAYGKLVDEGGKHDHDVRAGVFRSRK